MPFSKRKFFFFLGLFLFFLILNLFQFSHHLEDFFSLFSAPLGKKFFEANLKTREFFSFFQKIKKLAKEKKACQFEKEKLLSKLALLENLKKENEYLREALELNLNEKFDLALARPFAFDLKEKVFFINKGKKDKLKEGMPLISAHNVLVGRIIEVYPHFSKAIFIFNKKSSFLGKVLEKDVVGLIKGKGNFLLSFENLPKEKKIQEGDIVVTQGKEGIFPPGLLVGKISKIENLPLFPFQKAKILPFLKIENLDFVFLIKNFK